MSREMYDIIECAKHDLRDWANDNPTDTEPHDTISEITDSSVPVYTRDLLELAVEDLWLATEEPELGPAFDGSPTPANIIAANVYAKIEAALWDFWHEIETERKEAADAEPDDAAETENA